MHFKWGADLVWWWSEIFPWKPGLLWWRRIRRVDNVGWGEKVPFFSQSGINVPLPTGIGRLLKWCLKVKLLEYCAVCVGERERNSECDESTSGPGNRCVFTTVVVVQRSLLEEDGRGIHDDHIRTWAFTRQQRQLLFPVFGNLRDFHVKLGGVRGGGGGLPFTLVLLLFLTVTL